MKKVSFALSASLDPPGHTFTVVTSSPGPALGSLGTHVPSRLWSSDPGVTHTQRGPIFIPSGWPHPACTPSKSGLTSAWLRWWSSKCAYPGTAAQGSSPEEQQKLETNTLTSIQWHPCGDGEGTFPTQEPENTKKAPGMKLSASTFSSPVQKEYTKLLHRSLSMANSPPLPLLGLLWRNNCSLVSSTN